MLIMIIIKFSGWTVSFKMYKKYILFRDWNSFYLIIFQLAIDNECVTKFRVHFRSFNKNI